MTIILLVEFSRLNSKITYSWSIARQAFHSYTVLISCCWALTNESSRSDGLHPLVGYAHTLLIYSYMPQVNHTLGGYHCITYSWVNSILYININQALIPLNCILLVCTLTCSVSSYPRVCVLSEVCWYHVREGRG